MSIISVQYTKMKIKNDLFSSAKIIQTFAHRAKHRKGRQEVEGV